MSVEITRLLIVLLLTAAGQRSALAVSASDLSELLGATLGAGTGYVAGGIVGRRLSVSLGKIEEGQLPWSAAELISGGVFGLLCGSMGALAGVAGLVVLGLTWGAPVLAVTIWLGLALGVRMGLRRSRDLWELIGLRPAGLASTRRIGETPSAGGSLLDSSVVLDPRLGDLARSGVLPGDLIVPRFVLDEVQAIADAVDPVRRRRGRRALEQLDALDREPRIGLRVLDDDVPDVPEVDAKLVVLGRRLGLRLVTNDRPLARIAEIQGVRSLNLARLAQSLREQHLPGAELTLEIVREGSERGQGIGFTSDGDMVVVSDSSRLVGSEVLVSIAHSVPTAKGTMFFATVAPDGDTAGHETVPDASERLPMPPTA